MKKRILNLLKLVSVLSLLILASCEIGLGAAVDTEPPTIVTDQPSADSYVRDTFIMSGTWTDDQGVTQVSLSFVDTNDTSLVYGPFDATVDNYDEEGDKQQGSWNCTVDPIELGIPDGTYTVTATAYDEAEHTSISTTTFTVDNTAPLIVLESPSTTAINNPNTYGQTFIVTGKAADDSDVDSIDFIFFDKDGNEIHRKNITGVGTQLEVTVAQWGDDVYDKIYGKDKEAGTKAYYVGLVAYDSARKVPAVEGDKGNAATSFYLWDTLERSIGTVKTSVGYKVMNGRSAVPAATRDLWIKALNELKIEKATFSLNPVNNPTFEVSRYESFAAGQGKLDSQAKEFTNKNTININLYRGRDNKAIQSDTIGVYLVECDVNGNALAKGKRIPLIYPFKDANGNVLTKADGKKVTAEEHDKYIKSVDSAYAISLSINKEEFPEIEFNRYYLVDVVGYDNNNVPVRNTNLYGFKFMTAAVAPKIKITNPDGTSYIPQASEFTVEGSISTQEDVLEIKVYNNSDASENNIAKNITVVKQPYDKDKEEHRFSFKINPNDYKLVGGNLPTLIIKAIPGSGQTASVELKVDSYIPTFSITEINGVAQPLSKNSPQYSVFAKSSDSFIVKGTAADTGSGLDDFIYYYLTKDKDYGKDQTAYTFDDSWSKAAVQKGSWTANIDISAGYEDGVEYVLNIGTKDKAGNVSLISENPSNKIILKPDQKGPVFVDLDASTDGDQHLNVSVTKVIASTTGNIDLSVKVKDSTSGVDSSKVKLIQNNVETNTCFVLSDAATGEYTLSIPSSIEGSGAVLTNGTNLFKVRAYDLAGNYTDCNGVTVVVDKAKPTVTFNAVLPTVTENDITYVNGKVTVKGIVTDETQLKSVTATYKDKNDTPTTDKIYEYTDGEQKLTYYTLEHTIDTRNLKDGVKTKVTITAEDLAGNKEVYDQIELDVKQSTDEPKINAKAPLSNDNYGTDAITVGNNLFTTTSSIAADINDDDGIKEIVVKVNGTEKYKKQPTGSPASYNLSVGLSEDLGITSVGDYTIQIEVTDSALEVTSATNVINIAVDDAAPSLSLETTASDDKKKDGIYYVKDYFDITAKVKDDYKFGSLTWNENGATSNTVTGTVEDNSEQTKTITFAKPAGSKKSELTFTASDKFGQKTVKTQTYIFDLDKPIISGITYSRDASGGVYYYAKDNSFTIKGTAADSTSNAALQSGLESVEFIVYSGHHADYDSAIAAVDAATATVTKTWQSTTGTKNWTAKLDSDSISAEGEYTVFIRATDLAGNETVSSGIKVVADAAKPVIEITDINGSSTINTYYTGAVTVKGKVTETYLRKFEVTGATLSSTPAVVTTGTIANPQDWEITVPATDGQYAVTITAEDEVYTGTSAVKNTDIKFAIDTKAPTFTISKIKGEAYTSGAVSAFGNTTDYFTVEGTVQDAKANNYASGLESSINYIVKKSSDPLPGAATYTIDNTWSSVPIKSDGTWSAPISFASFADGDECVIYFAVKDKAGNTSTITGNPSNVITVTIDGTDPEIKTPTLAIGATETVITVAARDVAVNGGNVTPGSGIQSAVISLEGKKTWTPASTSSAAGTGSNDGYTVYTYKITNGSADLRNGENNFTIRVTDNAGNIADSTAVTINNNAPEINAAIAGSLKKDGEYSLASASFTMNGTVSISDAAGTNLLKGVSWQDEDDSGNTTGLKGAASTIISGAFTETVDPASTGYASYENKKITRVFTASNVFGRTSTAKVKFITDITKPVIQTADVKAGAVVKADGLKLGGKTKTELTTAWLKATTLPVVGSYLDNGTGVEKITYYKAAPGDGGDIYTSTVTYGGNTYYTFDGSIPGFAEGDANKVYFTATDKAGNTVLDAEEVTFKIDTRNPEIKTLQYGLKSDLSDAKDVDGTILTNCSADIYLSGTFADEGPDSTTAVSGVKAINVKLNGTNVAAANGITITPADGVGGTDYSSGTWTVQLDRAKLGNTETTVTIVLEITDNAENANSSKTLSVKIDKTAPTVTVESPDTSALLNGKLTFSGKAKDTNNIKSISLYKYFSASQLAALPTANANLTAWGDAWMSKEVGATYSLSDVGSWKWEDVDVETLEGYTSALTEAYLYVLPVAYDEAGNCSINPASIKLADCKEFHLDRNSDRPVIKFSNISWDSTANSNSLYVRNAANLIGSITDDDGIEELRIAVSASDMTDAPADFLTDSKYKVDVKSGSFSKPLGDDGDKYLWFYVKDKGTKKFGTKDSTSYLRPYVIFDGHVNAGGDEVKDDNNSVIHFISDSIAPTINHVAFGYGAANNAVANYADFAEKNLAGGTKRNWVVLKVDASDAGSGLADDATTVTAKVTVGGSEKTYALNRLKNASDEYTGTEYYSEPINVMSDVAEEKWTEGNNTITFTVKDRSGFETIETKTLTVDKSAPTAELISPENEVYGTVTLKGTAADTYSDVEVVKYLIPDDDVTSVATTIAAINGTVTGYNTGASARSWMFVLNGKNGNQKLPLTETEVAKFSNTTHTTDDIYTMPVYLYVEDILGNSGLVYKTGITPYTITYNPYGTRPRTTVVSPEGEYGTANDVTNYQNVNGSFRVNGSVTCNTSLNGGKVYIQIDANKDGLFDDADKALIKAMKVDGTAVYTVIDDITAAAVVASYDDSALGTEAKWGIEVSGTNNWNFTLNSSGEFQKDDAKLSGGKYKYGVRAVARSGAGVYGKWSTGQYFMIDMNAPAISTNAELVTSTDATTSQSYYEDMYLRGYQYLKLVVTDKTGLKKISYSYASQIKDIVSNPVETVNVAVTDTDYISDRPSGTVITRDTTKTDANGEPYVEYTVYIPVSKLSAKAGTSNVALKVTAYKNSDSESTDYQRYAMSFDNTAPDVTNLTFNGQVGDTAVDSMSNKIVNSNGDFFTVGGKIHDEGSGFDRIAFYYYRDRQGAAGQKRRVYDPMKTVTMTETEVLVTQDVAAKTLVSGIKSRTIKSDANATVEAPIYGYEQNVTISDNGTTITLSSNNMHIRAGGLVQIEGFWHVISAKTGTTLTLKTATTATGTKTAFFPIAQVIDNTGSEKTQSNGELLAANSGDDGDGMPESIIKAGSYWTYDASIKSKNIPDGPGTLVTFIWDKAGNVEVKTYTASVQNNAPRLTKLWLGTDLSGNGFEQDEFTEFDVLAKVGETSGYEMATETYNNRKRFRVKGDMAVVAEFVGGNNYKNTSDGSRIKMVFNKDASSETAGYVQNKTATPISVMSSSTTTPYYDSTLSGKTWFTNSVISGKTPANFAYVIKKGLLGNDSAYSTDYTKRVMSFTFWDDTAETTQGTDSCYAYLKINDLIVMCDDNFAPVVSIDPFYWRGPDDNSLYENSYLNGHIDLPKSTGATFDKALGMYKSSSGKIVTGTPDVSGIVSFRGSALDEHTLGSLWVKFTGFTPAEGTYFGDADDGYYNVANLSAGTWTTNAGTFANGKWTDAAAPVTASGTTWKFKILSDSSTQEGQLVEWQLDIDTSAITGACGSDKALEVMARDEVYVKCGDGDADGGKHKDKEPADHQSSGTTANATLKDTGKYDLTIEGTNVPQYTVNVVPYISGVQGATRSRLGRYSVRTGETVTLTGFNFPSSGLTVTRHKTDNTTKKASTTAESDTITATRASATTITFTAPAKSGYINVSFGTDKECKNNTNDDIYYNIQEGYDGNDETSYGRNAANKNGKNFWTDDVYLSVWKSGGKYSDSIGACEGQMVKVESDAYMTMEGNSCSVNKDHLASFWFANNQTWEEIYKDKDNEKSDIRKANVSKSSDGGGGRTAPATCLAIAYPKGYYTGETYTSVPKDYNRPFYLISDNSYSANTPGTGLELFRDQNVYANKSRGDKGYTLDIGSYETIMTNKYVNPSIAAYYLPKAKFTDYTGLERPEKNDNGVYYVYVTYYDIYSHCLKYAAALYTADYGNNASAYATFLVCNAAVGGGKATGAASVIAGTDDSTYTSEAGQWSQVVIDVTTPTAPKPIIGYYNMTNKRLEIVRGSNVAPGFDSGTWNKIVLKSPNGSSNFGSHMSMEIDGKGGLHIVAQDSTNSGALYYGYIDHTTLTGAANNSELAVSWKLVDSESNAVQISIALDNYKNSGISAKPVITYKNNSEADLTKAGRIAYIVSGDKLDNIIWECVGDSTPNQVGTYKLNSASNVFDDTNTKCLAALGYCSSEYYVDFLRDE